LFVVDDLGWTDLGFMVNTYNSTPNIDKIAAEAIVFKKPIPIINDLTSSY
jgi:arylsulfatase A-like enzyme